MKIINGLTDLYRYLFNCEDRLSEAWLRSIQAEEEQAAFAREMDGARIVQPRTVADGPPSKALSRVSVR